MFTTFLSGSFLLSLAGRRMRRCKFFSFVRPDNGALCVSRLLAGVSRAVIVEVDENDQPKPRKASIDIGQMLPTKRFIKAKPKGAHFHATMLDGADLPEADLEDADLTHSMLFGTNFSRANLVDANFEGSMLLGTHLENAQINCANFKNTSWLTRIKLMTGVEHRKGYLKG